MPSDAESKSDRCWEKSSPIITELIDDLAGVTQSWVVAELAPRLTSLGVFISSSWPHCFPMWLKLLQKSLHPVRNIAGRGWKWREWGRKSWRRSSFCRGGRDQKRKCRGEGASSTICWAPPGHSFGICWEMLSLSLLYRIFPGAQVGGCARR